MSIEGRKILRRPRVLDRVGFGKSNLYVKIADGLFTPPVKLGLRASGWPDDEVDEINAAVIAGSSETEIRELVARLVAARGAKAAK